MWVTLLKRKKGDARKIHFDMPYGTIICNPPYGERIGEIKECEKLYKEIGKKALMHLISGRIILSRQTKTLNRCSEKRQIKSVNCITV